ncbi:MAG: DNA polymerase III subunit chi [Chitinophagaceae bacterium]|nr:DNA polymerase III subunit chi [Rubrivivax sp.]
MADPLDFACRLLRKAYRSGVRVQVTAPPERLAALDRLLWTFDERDFVPHVRLESGPADPDRRHSASAAQAARTPIWLLEQALSGDWADAAAAGPVAAPRVLVNLGGSAASTPEAFERVIEIVSHDAEEAQAGRQRWRDYKARGLDIAHQAH